MSQMFFRTAAWNLMNWHIFKLIIAGAACSVWNTTLKITQAADISTGWISPEGKNNGSMGAIIQCTYMLNISWHLFISKTPYILDNIASRAATHWLVVHFERPFMFATNNIKQQAWKWTEKFQHVGTQSGPAAVRMADGWPLRKFGWAFAVSSSSS